MSPAEFAALVCKNVRQGGKKVWFAGAFDVDGQPVRVKAFGYWAQVLEIGGFRDGGPMGIKTGKAFRAYLEGELARAARSREIVAQMEGGNR